MAIEQRPAGCLLRLFWMAIGNIAIFLIGMRIAQSSEPRLGLDVAYWLAVILTIGARFAEIRYYGGTDGFGVPATPGLWRRYAIKMLLVGGVAWIVFRFLIAGRG